MNTKLIKIAFITPLYPPANISGSSKIVQQIAEELVKIGHRVTVITSNALTARYWYDPLFGKKIVKRHETINGVTVYRLPCDQIRSSLAFILYRYLRKPLLRRRWVLWLQIWSSGPYLRSLQPVLKQGDFDVLHVSPFPFALNLQVARAIAQLRRRPRLVITPFFHAELGEFHNPILQEALNQADGVHVISHAERKSVLSSFAITEDKITIIPLFLSLNEMADQSSLQKEASQLIKTYKLQGRKVVLFAGNKGKLKGACDTLLSVYRLFKKDPSFLLIAIGNITREWGQTKRIVDQRCVLDLPYLPVVSKEAFFSLCQVFCMPSKSESFGLVYLEAWHKKKPVIAAQIEAVEELVGGAGGGLLIEYGTVNQIQQAITTLIVDDQKQARELGENGYRALIDQYNLHTVISQYEQLLTGASR